MVEETPPATTTEVAKTFEELINTVFAGVPAINHISKALTTLSEKRGDIHATCKELNITRENLLHWAKKFNAQVPHSSRIPLRRFYTKTVLSAERREQAIQEYRQGAPVSALARKYGVHMCTIYSWINALKNNPAAWARRQEAEKAKRVIPKLPNKSEPADPGMSFSLTEDFGLNTPEVNNSEESSNEIQFCPCCGANIKAVRIALQTYQQIKQKG